MVFFPHPTIEIVAVHFLLTVYLYLDFQVPQWHPGLPKMTVLRVCQGWVNPAQICGPLFGTASAMTWDCAHIPLVHQQQASTKMTFWDNVFQHSSQVRTLGSCDGFHLSGSWRPTYQAFPDTKKEKHCKYSAMRLREGNGSYFTWTAVAHRRSFPKCPRLYIIQSDTLSSEIFRVIGCLGHLKAKQPSVLVEDQVLALHTNIHSPENSSGESAHGQHGAIRQRGQIELTGVASQSLPQAGSRHKAPRLFETRRTTGQGLVFCLRTIKRK